MPDQYLNIRFRIKSEKHKDDPVTPGYYTFDRMVDLSKASAADVNDLVSSFLKAAESYI